jgi:integrase
MTTLSPDEVSLLLQHAQGNDYYSVIYTAISTGLRRNEILGLRWRDVDLLMASISVSQVLYKGKGRIEMKEPKTEHSRRRVAMTPKLAIYLREHKERQEQVMRRSLTLDDLVFSHPDGTPLDPSTVSHSFNKIVKAAGLKVRFHDLRHSCASLMLREGIHPKIVSEMLGHSSVAITLDIYSHVTPGLQEAAAKSLNEVLPEGITSV